MPIASKRYRPGLSSTALSGRLASTGWTNTSQDSDRSERRTKPMAEINNSEDAVVIERILDAPVDVVWQMWTIPELFKVWYGPDGATIPVAKMDVRLGG